MTYMVYPILVGASVLRDATGNETAYLIAKDNYADVTQNPEFNLVTNNGSCQITDQGQSLCAYGLQNSFQVLIMFNKKIPTSLYV